MAALLKVLAQDVARCLWQGLVLTGMARSPSVYGACRADNRCRGIDALFAHEHDSRS